MIERKQIEKMRKQAEEARVQAVAGANYHTGRVAQLDELLDALDALEALEDAQGNASEARAD